MEHNCDTEVVVFDEISVIHSDHLVSLKNIVFKKPLRYYELIIEVNKLDSLEGIENLMPTEQPTDFMMLDYLDDLSIKADYVNLRGIENLKIKQIRITANNVDGLDLLPDSIVGLIFKIKNITNIDFLLRLNNLEIVSIDLKYMDIFKTKILHKLFKLKKILWYSKTEFFDCITAYKYIKEMRIEVGLKLLYSQLIKDKIRLIWSRFFYSSLDKLNRSRYMILAISEDKLIHNP